MSKVRLSLDHNYRMKVKEDSGKKTIYTDVSKEYGGLEEYMSPTDLLCVSIGSCMGSIMAMYAFKIGADITGLEILVGRELGAKHQINSITIEVACPTLIDASTAERLERASLNCPVYHALHPDIKKTHHFEWNKKPL